MPYLEVKTRQGNKRMKLDGSTITIGRLQDNVLQLMDEIESVSNEEKGVRDKLKKDEENSEAQVKILEAQKAEKRWVRDYPSTVVLARCRLIVDLGDVPDDDEVRSPSRHHRHVQGYDSVFHLYGQRVVLGIVGQR